MKKIKVKQYTRYEKRKRIRVPQHKRKKRPRGKQKIVSKKPMKEMYSVRDEYGQFKGYKFQR